MKRPKQYQPVEGPKRGGSFTAWEYNAVLGYLEWLKEKGLADKDCGSPLEVAIDWAKREIRFTGHKASKTLKMDHILKAAVK